jgi:hypothetical protein
MKPGNCSEAKNKPTLPNIILLLAMPAILFACNFPQPTAMLPLQITNSPTSTPQVTLKLSPGLRSLKTLPTLNTPTPTAAQTIDAFFARCPTAAEIAAVSSAVTLAFETDPTAGTLVCKASDGSADLTALKKRAYQSVLIMERLAFDAPLPWTAKSLSDWFHGSIHGIRFRSDITYSYCCEPANTIDIAVASNSYLMLTDRWIDDSIGGGLMDTMVLFVHEARHNAGYPHTCANGQDDKTIGELGAWGIQFYLLQWLAQHSDRAFLAAPGGDPALYRRIALSDSLMIQRSRFCNEPTATPGDAPTLAFQG